MEAVLERPQVHRHTEVGEEAEEEEPREEGSTQNELELADREFALKLSQRLNDETPQIPSSIVIVEEPEKSTVNTVPTTETAVHNTEDEDYQLALRLSQELNAEEPRARQQPQQPQQPPPQTLPPQATVVYAVPYATTTPVVYVPAPPRPSPLSQEEADRRLAMQLQQELNGDEGLDREVALRVSQELNGEVPASVLVPPPPPPRTVYATPGRYVVVRSAEEIRVEGEIARISQAIGKETDPDVKIALDLQLQELVAYQRQLQRRKIRNEYSDEDEEDVIEDGLKMLDAGYEKFKGFSKDVVQTLDRYGGKFEKAINKFAKKIIGEDGKESTTDINSAKANGGEVESSSEPLLNQSEPTDEQPLARGRPTSSELKDKGLSLKIVETIDKVTEELGDTVAEIIFGDKSKANSSSTTNNSNNVPSTPPLSRSSSSVKTTATTANSSSSPAPATISTGTTTSGLTDFKGGDAKDSEDSLYPL